MQPQKACDWLKNCRPPWLDFETDEFGIKVHTGPTPEMLEWWGTINEGVDSYHKAAWAMIGFATPFDNEKHLEVVASYGSRCRKALLDDAFRRNALIIIRATGEVMVNELPNAWLSQCVGYTLRRRSSLEHLSVLRNWVQPRWIVIAEDCTWICRVNSAMLALAGDVEKNPGPKVMMVLLLTLTTIFLFNIMNDVSQTSTWAARVIRIKIRAPLERHARNCALTQAKNEYWQAEYAHGWFVGLKKLFHEVPELDDVYHVPFTCHLVYKMVGKPTMAYHGPGWVATWKTGLSWVASLWMNFRFWNIVAMWAVVGWFAAISILVCAVVCLTSRKGRVRVINKNGTIDLNWLKSQIDIKGEMPKERSTGHDWLAKQRRVCEAAVIDLMLSMTSSFRDVGGSRTRWAHLGKKKHLCCPDYNNDDILRELKSKNVFDDCKLGGEHCPLRKTVPFAMLSHVDYHMTQDQLVRTITGPTFILTHDFVSRPVGFGKVLGEYEADVTYFGDQITMTTRDGTKYSHGYHRWLNEGSVVTQSGAFVYCLLTRYHDTSIYFAYPAEGVYSRNDINVMELMVDNTYPMINGYCVRKDYEKRVFQFTRVGQSFEVPSETIEECANALAPAERNEKYVAAVFAYVPGKCKAKSIDTSNIDEIVRLVCYLSDVRALYTVPNATCIRGNPVDFRRRDLYKLRVLMWLKHFGPAALTRFTSRTIDNVTVRRLTAWTFPKVIVPTYEIYTKMNRSSYISTSVANFARERFQPSPTPANARVNEHTKCCTGEDSGECNNIIRNASAKHGPTPEPIIDQPTRGGAGVSHDDGPSTSTTPAGESVRGQGARADGPVFTKSREEPDSNRSEGSGVGGRSVHVPAGTIGTVQPREGESLSSADARHCCASNWLSTDKSLAIETAFGDKTGTKVVLDEDVAIGLMGLSVTGSEECLRWIDSILQEISRIQPAFGRRTTIARLCGLASGVLPVSKGRVLDDDGCSVYVERYDGVNDGTPGTFGFQHLVAKVSRKEKGTTAESTGQGRKIRMVEERQNNKKFSKDRNHARRNRSAEHQSA
jgi:hypothetical protein